VACWEITNYLEGYDIMCVNTMPGHNRHIWHFGIPNRGKAVLEAFDFVACNTATKLFHLPIAVFFPILLCLVIK
jgi:hypothetical protein